MLKTNAFRFCKGSQKTTALLQQAQEIYRSVEQYHDLHTFSFLSFFSMLKYVLGLVRILQDIQCIPPTKAVSPPNYSYKQYLLQSTVTHVGTANFLHHLLIPQLNQTFLL